ncbi:unnamed protein product, partial [Ectocarpus sp. 12 AP-2014]
CTVLYRVPQRKRTFRGNCDSLKHNFTIRFFSVASGEVSSRSLFAVSVISNNKTRQSFVTPSHTKFYFFQRIEGKRTSDWRHPRMSRAIYRLWSALNHNDFPPLY